MFWFSLICTLANLFNRGSVESLKSSMPSSSDNLEAEEEEGSRVGMGEGTRHQALTLTAGSGTWFCPGHNYKTTNNVCGEGSQEVQLSSIKNIWCL